jgi:hypothetical protein
VEHWLIYKKIVLIILIILTCFFLLPKKGISSADKIALPHLDSNASVVIYISEVPKSRVSNKSMLLGDCEKYRHIIEQYDWNVDTAMEICKHESEGREWVVNDNPATKDYSVGLFQINLFGANAKYRPSEATLKIPEENVAYAYELYKSSGFQSQWGVCRRDVKCI